MPSRTRPDRWPGVFARQIDHGMRSGIPREDWPAVTTLYKKDADTLAQFTGNENALPGRVILLDETGKVLYFHDQGYSVNALLRLKEKLPE